MLYVYKIQINHNLLKVYKEIIYNLFSEKDFQNVFLLYFIVQEEDEDRMMVEWFELVNNKNELVRKEGDLIYL